MMKNQNSITWRPGGLRAASDRDGWIPAEGRTGFLNGNRVVEEPNPFGRLIRSLFKKNLSLQIDEEPNILNTPDAVYDAIMTKFFKEQRLSHQKMSLKIRITLFVVDTNGEHPEARGWIILMPDGNPGRMTSRETWIVNSDLRLNDFQVSTDALDIP